MVLLLVMAFNINNVQKVSVAKYVKLVKFLRENNNTQTQVFVSDWAYCDNFVNPEIYGLRYYGLKKIKIILLKYNFPHSDSLLHPEQLSVDKHLYVVNFLFPIGIWLENYLKTQPRVFRKIEFGSITVFDIEKECYTADWASPKGLP